MEGKVTPSHVVKVVKVLGQTERIFTTPGVISTIVLGLFREEFEDQYGSSHRILWASVRVKELSPTGESNSAALKIRYSAIAGP